MKKKNFMLRMLCAVFACIFLLSMLSLSVCAADEPAEQGGGDGPSAGDEPAADDNPVDVPDAADEPAEDPADEPADTSDSGDGDTEDSGDDPDAGYVTPNDPPESEEDYWGTLPEATSGYVAPENLNQLPAVKSEDVAVATALPVPTAEVSNASLFSGIVMWICVAVGIAVVVGVLVSKRTRRRGS